MNTIDPEMPFVDRLATNARPPVVAKAATLDAVPRLLLRAEAGLALVGALFAFHRLGASWWLFAALFLAPDLSFFGYVASRPTGAKVYNAVHTYLSPTALALVGFALLPSVLPIAAVWVAHIAADRLMGYGLKYSSSTFGDTHLGDPNKEHRRLVHAEGEPTGDAAVARKH